MKEEKKPEKITKPQKDGNFEQKMKSERKNLPVMSPPLENSTRDSPPLENHFGMSPLASRSKQCSHRIELRSGVKGNK